MSSWLSTAILEMLNFGELDAPHQFWPVLSARRTANSELTCLAVSQADCGVCQVPIALCCIVVIVVVTRWVCFAAAVLLPLSTLYFSKINAIESRMCSVPSWHA